MSADPEIDAIRRSYEALAAGDREALDALVEELMHPECEWVPFLTGVEGRSYHGHDGMLEFFDDFLSAFSARYDIDEMRRIGPDAVLVLGRMHLRGRESGVDVAQELGVLFVFDDGLIRHARASDHATAIAAAEAVRA